MAHLGFARSAPGPRRARQSALERGGRKSTDVGFESSGCGKWSSNLSRVTSSMTQFGQGTFIVNTDIKPGTYRSSTGDGCYWA